MKLVTDTNVVVSGLLWLGNPGRLLEAAATGQLTLYTSPALLVPPGEFGTTVGWLDQALGDVNPYYRSSGRQTLRLGLPELRIVRSGTFASLLDQQRNRAAPASSSQVKTPRRVSLPEQLALLEEGTIGRTSRSGQGPG